MTTNTDPDTGIRYGAISQNSLDLDAINDWYDNDAVYDDQLKELREKINDLFEFIGFIGDEKKADLRDEIEQIFNDNYNNDEPAFYFEDKEYKAEYSHSLNCWIILKSPYYTYCEQCSPCVPNAGNLDNPIDKDMFEANLIGGNYMIGVIAYCLPVEFFDDEYHKIPYRYYRVDGDQEVQP